MTNIVLGGFVRDNAGGALTDPTVELFDRNDTATVLDTASLSSTGYWSFDRSPDNDNTDRYDVRVTNGSEQRFLSYDDKVQLTSLETAYFRFRNPTGAQANKYVYDIVGSVITDDRTLTLPLITGTDTLAVLGLAQTFTAAQTFSSTVTIGTSLIPDAADGATIGSASAEWSDLYLADGAVIYLGNDQDVSLTHVADTGILLSSSDRLQFGDSGTYINQSTDGQLDLVADTEIQIAATTIDLNGAVAFDGALTGITNITLSGTLSDGNYTFDTSGNVSGLGTIGSGNITSTGTIQGTTITATTAFVPDASDGAALGTTSLEFSDLYLADGAVLGFGDDQDVTLTHVEDTGLLLSSTDKLQFGDAGTFIHQSADGVLTIESDTTVDINGAVVLNGAITGATNITLSGELDAATLDIEGNADINGTLEADAYTVAGTTLAEYIADTAGAMFSSNTETGITATYQDGDNTIDLVVGTLNQDTTGTAATVTTAAQGAITSLGTLTTLTVDNVIIDGATIGHTSDGDLMTVADGTLTVAGTVDIGPTDPTPGGKGILNLKTTTDLAVECGLYIHHPTTQGYRSGIWFANNTTNGGSTSEHVTSKIEGTDSLHFYTEAAADPLSYVLALQLGGGPGDATFANDINYPGDLTDTSDRRVKGNIQTISGALGKVAQMRGVSYDRLYGNRASRVGLVAQELELIAPELVKTGDSESSLVINVGTADEATITGVKSVNYSKLVAYLVEAIKELKTQVDQL